MNEEHPLVQLARESINAFVRRRETVDPPDTLVEAFDQPGGAFVSLHACGQLRGCIGTIAATQANVVEEVIHNAISAATRDPRFSPVLPDELGELEISVDLLGAPEAIDSVDELDPVTYGVIVQHGTRRGLLLPNLEGIDTAEEQVAIALRKAWIDPKEGYQLYRFRVDRYH